MTKRNGFEVVGIAGVTCTGKTSLISELQRRLGYPATRLSLDEYDLYPAGSAAMEDELNDPKIVNWEDPELFDMQQFGIDVGKLSLGEPVRLRTRSRESMADDESSRLIKPLKTNLVEGIFAFHNPLARAAMDLRVFIDLPLDIMVERRLATLRPGSDGNPWDDPEYITGQMVEGTKRNVLPQRDHAHFVLDGQLSVAQLADQLLGG